MSVEATRRPVLAHWNPLALAIGLLTGRGHAVLHPVPVETGTAEMQRVARRDI